jgi:2-hydroxy-3-oxopropionate reductase
MKVGFIGVGVIGEHMCRNIMKTGHDVAVYDSNPEPVKKLAAEGAKPKKSSAEVAQASEVIVTMLPNSSHVQAVILGENGVLQGLQRGTVVIDMSTISPRVSVEVAQKVKEAGGVMIDAPVVKSVPAAIRETWGSWWVGRWTSTRRCFPSFGAWGKTSSVWERTARA